MTGFRLEGIVGTYNVMGVLHLHKLEPFRLVYGGQVVLRFQQHVEKTYWRWRLGGKPGS